ncbi:PKD domain-containing protein [Chloroflexota bacterium]
MRINKSKLARFLTIPLVLVLSLTLLASSVAMADTGEDDEGLGVTDVLLGSIVPVVTETGYISLSVDGAGTNTASAIIQVEKPAGATVRSAYMAAASAGFSRRTLANGDITIDGAGVNWNPVLTTPSSINSWNSWADVTSMVKSKIDSSPAGLINFTITEVNTSGIDGEILAVIFDDPNQAVSNTIVLLYGAQHVDGDTFNIGLASPLDKSDPNLVLDLSLGISFGYQDYYQYSIVDVNGARMTTSAGGQDDGEPANGALLTVGGLNDSNTNPPDPFQTPTGTPAYRYDDELYNILPYVNTGESNITVFSSNPSNDDNIFFAGLFLGSTAAVVGEGIVLGPASAVNEVNTPHTVKATVQDDDGNPVVGRDVTFNIVSGPNAGLSYVVATGSDGKASYTYTSTVTGIDTIEASFVDSRGNTKTSNQVTKEWTAPANTPPVADAGGPYVTTENFPVEFDGGASTDPENDVLEYRWDFDSDGTYDTGWSPFFKASNMWCDDYNGTVTLQVRDTGGLTDTDTATVEVTNLAPVIDKIKADATEVQCKDQPITFTGIGKDPGCDTVRVEWDFGNGTTYVDITQVGPPFNSVVTYTYGEFGDYTVTLTVTDDDGGSAVASIDVAVWDTTPPVLSGQCVEGVNPHGNNIPGKNRDKNGKGDKKNVNPDGFYLLDFTVEDNCDQNPQLWVGTADNPFIFPIEPGITVKFTESDDAEPEMKKIGSPAQGGATAVTWHIILPGDPVITAIDASGNYVTCDSCLVPPPPM